MTPYSFLLFYFHFLYQIVYSSFVDLLPKEVREDDPSLQKPSEDELKEVNQIMIINSQSFLLFRKQKKHVKLSKLLYHRRYQLLCLFNMPKNKHLLNIFVIHHHNKERLLILVPNNVLFKWLKFKKILWNHHDLSKFKNNYILFLY